MKKKEDIKKNLKGSVLFSERIKRKILSNWDSFSDKKKKKLENTIDSIKTLEKQLLDKARERDKRFDSKLKNYLDQRKVKLIKDKEKAKEENDEDIENLLDNI